MEVKILLVDDDIDIQEFISYNLRKESYSVFQAYNGHEAIQLAKKHKPHLIILDVMMPEMDGMETCRRIREIKGLNNVMICFLSARAEDYSQIAGYDAGADDYITKPVKLNILIKKVKSLLRRILEEEKKFNLEEIVLKSMTVNSRTHTVIIQNKEIILPKKEFLLLRLLASNPDKVFDRDEIYTEVWGEDIIVGDRTIDVHVRKIRQKIGNQYIKTLKSVGYKFENV
jgi:two-component system, OmpR family, alkaline phosphatase synthesis response regulator PhoP